LSSQEAGDEIGNVGVGTSPDGIKRRRRMEIFAFLFLTAVLMPALTVAVVGGFGLTVWVYQMLAGPPGPPAR
jgi:periplasmic nitrate reductase NapE